MRRIYLTLAGRVDSPEDSPEDVGEVLIIDWDTKKVLRRLIADSSKTVEEGRSRGASGIAWHEDKIYVGCREAIVVFDPYDAFEIVNILHLGDPAGFHQLKSHDGLLYVVCTGGNAFKSVRNDHTVEYVPLLFRDERYLHFNSIGWSPSGKQYHLYMGIKKVFNYTDGIKLGVKLGNMPHDICFIDEDRFLYTNSAYGELRLYDIANDTDIQILKKPAVTPRVNPGYQIRGFMRGVAYDAETGTVFVATAPGTLYEINVENWQQVDSAIVNDRNGCAVYDILLDPRDWNFQKAPRVLTPPAPPSLPLPPLPPPPPPPPSTWDNFEAAVTRRSLRYKAVYYLTTHPFRKLYRRFKAWNSYHDLEE